MLPFEASQLPVIENWINVAKRDVSVSHWARSVIEAHQPKCPMEAVAFLADQFRGAVDASDGLAVLSLAASVLSLGIPVELECRSYSSDRLIDCFDLFVQDSHGMVPACIEAMYPPTRPVSVKRKRFTP